MQEKNKSRRNFLINSTLVSISVMPAVSKLAHLIGVPEQKIPLLIDCAFRLTEWESLLNLEFYFINVDYKDNTTLRRKRKIIASYGQEECYMIVRLPQQHIAEQSYDLSETLPNGSCVFNDKDAPPYKWIAQTRIAGYSYIVFRINFKNDQVEIPLTKDSLMDWNNAELFSLVVKRDRDKGSLFSVELAGKGKENTYPLNYSVVKGTGIDAGVFNKYDYNKFPKIAGTPITVIEAPWRLFLSPALPDQERFKWKWDFSKNPIKKYGKIEAELWRATLTIEEKAEYKEDQGTKKEKDAAGSSVKKEMDEIMNKIELLILGSPDHPTPLAGIDDIFEKDTNNKGHILPSSKNRSDLVELYIKYNLVARTDKLTFSPLGVTVYIEFDNTKIEETTGKDVLKKIYLLQWKQLISLGRDQEVEVVTLVMDKEAGHKYLHIKSAKRRTKKGLSYLDYREYIMPFTPKVDYTSHATTGTANKFKSPFKSINIAELKPKRICPVKSMSEGVNLKTFTGITSVNEKNETIISDSRMYVPQTYNNESAPLTFEFESIDWMDQKAKFSKKLQLVELNINDAIRQNKTSVDQINTFFDKEINETNAAIVSIDKSYTALSKEIEDKIAGAKGDAIEKLNVLNEDFQFFRKRMMEWNPYMINLSFKQLTLKVDSFPNVKKEITALKDKVYVATTDIKKYVADNEAAYTKLVDQIKSDISEPALKNELMSLLPEVQKVYANIKEAWSALDSNPAFTTMKANATNLSKQIQELKNKEKEYRNQIDLFSQKVAYTVAPLEDKLKRGAREAVSNFTTDSILCKGALKTIDEGGKQVIDILHQHGSILQLEKGVVQLESINKTVNERLWLEVKHPIDYLTNQVDLLKLEVEKNASQVVAQLTEASQEFLKGKMRQAAADLGGYINPELPVEYLTYLKDPKKIPDRLKAELVNQFPQVNAAAEEFKEAYNDIVFLSESAKNQWKTIKSIKPGDYFDRNARLMGDILLKDVLGLDFELPRISNTPDHIIYQFNTEKIVNKDLGPVKFYARNKDKKSAIQVYLKKSIRSANEYVSFTRISDFSIAINLASQDVLIIMFSKLEVKSSRPGGKKTEVKIDDIAFGGALNFIGKLAEAIKMPGNGLRVVPSLKQIDIAYAFALPNIETPSFNFTNLKFDVGLRIPFPTAGKIKPITTILGINRPEDKFLITVGIFGGRGHFVLTASPKKIETVDAALEFGGYFGINLGIARGYVYLFAGIRYRSGDETILFDGYLICGGGVTVFGFISVSVTFLLMLSYQSVGGQATLYGTASVSYSVKIGFFKKSFTLRYSKRIAGSKGREVNPESTSYINSIKEDSNAYSYVGNPSLDKKGLHGPSSDYLDYEETGTDQPPPPNEKSFTSIYNKKTWDQYCSSFHF